MRSTMGAACYVQMNAGLSGGMNRILPIAPLMLFLGETEADEPDTAARDAAIDLGQRLERPVLLLDFAAQPGGQWAHFAHRNALLARVPPEPVAAGQAALQFYALHDSSLWVSTLAPPHAATDERFWMDQLAIWPTTRRRLLELFGAIVIAVPSVLRSSRGLGFAGQVEATILVLRDGDDVGPRGERMRAQVDAAGGRPVGIVLTGCDPQRPRPGRRREQRNW